MHTNVATGNGGLLLPLFTLTPKQVWGGIFSVALSGDSGFPETSSAFTEHGTLCCPDFPPSRFPETAIRRSVALAKLRVFSGRSPEESRGGLSAHSPETSSGAIRYNPYRGLLLVQFHFGGTCAILSVAGVIKSQIIHPLQQTVDLFF